MPGMTSRIDLSIVLPAYNEASTIVPLIERILAFAAADDRCSYEVIVVDDCSTDGTSALVAEKFGDRVKVIRQPVNMGKGAAVQMGFADARGAFLLVQDADNEYDPADIQRILRAAWGSTNAVVYGSRHRGARSQGGWRGVLGLWPGQSLGPWGFNKLLSTWFLALKHMWISDLLTGYKLYPAEVFEEWKPMTSGFETDHEITLHVVNKGYEIREVPIAYRPRTKAEGKKITSKDALIALTTIWRFR